MASCEGLELGDDVCVTPERKLGFDQLLVGAEPLVLEAGDFGLEKGRLGRSCERRPAKARAPHESALPHRRRPRRRAPRWLSRPAPCRSASSSPGERDRIAGATGLDPSPRRFRYRRAPCAAGRRAPARSSSRSREVVGPEVVHDAVERDRLVGVQEEQRERRWLASIHLDRPLVIADLERPEYQKLHLAPLA